MILPYLETIHMMIQLIPVMVILLLLRRLLNHVSLLECPNPQLLSLSLGTTRNEKPIAVTRDMTGLIPENALVLLLLLIGWLSSWTSISCAWQKPRLHTVFL